MEAPTAGLYTVLPPAPSVPPPVCPDAANPLFGFCVETLLRGCYEPDRSGTCTANQGVIRWSDGSTPTPTGTDAGLRGPDTQPCITIAMQDGAYRLTRGGQTLVYASGDDHVTSPVRTARRSRRPQPRPPPSNVCAGLSCPPGP